jgi:hypothetical protein
MTSPVLFLGLLSSSSILFVGNSYTMSGGGLWLQVKQIYESLSSDTLSSAGHTVGGASFLDHWNNQDLREQIESGEWDTVVFQEQSCMPVINPSQTYLYGDSLAWLVTASGSEPVFLMTWARKQDPLMLEGLELAYSRMGLVHCATVTPCGSAFDMLRQLYPELNLYEDDGSHPSLCGSYLAACVIAAAVFNVDILSEKTWQPAGISLSEGEILRQVASVSCLNYQQPSRAE